MEILLTDDELVALAVEQSRAWPTGLPTVAVELPDSLFAAALRGRRMLAVRDMFNPAAPGKELLELVRRDVVGATGLVCLYIADQVGNRMQDAVNINAFQSGTDWLVETVSDAGVHQFARLAPQELESLYLGLAQAAFERGLADEQADALWVAAISEDRRRSISVRRGVVARQAASAGEDVNESHQAAELAAELSVLLSFLTESSAQLRTNR